MTSKSMPNEAPKNKTDKQYPSNFTGRSVAHWRRVTIMTLQALGEVVGIHRQTLSKIEQGTAPLKDADIIKIAEALSVDPKELIIDWPDPTISDTEQKSLDRYLAKVRALSAWLDEDDLEQSIQVLEERAKYRTWLQSQGGGNNETKQR